MLTFLDTLYSCFFLFSAIAWGEGGANTTRIVTTNTTSCGVSWDFSGNACHQLAPCKRKTRGSDAGHHVRYALSEITTLGHGVRNYARSRTACPRHGARGPISDSLSELWHGLGQHVRNELYETTNL